MNWLDINDGHFLNLDKVFSAEIVSLHDDHHYVLFQSERFNTTNYQQKEFAGNKSGVIEYDASNHYMKVESKKFDTRQGAVNWLNTLVMR